MDLSDWVKTSIVAVGAYYIGNKLTGGALRNSIYRAKEKINDSFKNNDKVKYGVLGAGVGGVGGVVYSNNKEKVDKLIAPKRPAENYNKE